MFEVLFMPVFMGTLAENKGKSVPEVPTSSSIEDDDLDYDLLMRLLEKTLAESKVKSVLEDPTSSTISDSDLKTALLLRFLEKALAESKGKPVLEDSTSLTIGDSHLKTDADQEFKDKDNLFHESYIVYHQYRDHLDPKTPFPGLHNNHVGDNNDKNIHRRNIWDTVCKIPLELKNSDLECTYYDKKLVCTHSCQFGHAFSEGMIEREMECIYKEDKWTPVPDFQECKPFVDCGFSMTAAGSAECDDSFLLARTCEIFCWTSEEDEQNANSRYWCDIKGQWKPKLPPCAAPRSGKDLIPPPLSRKKNYGI